MAIKADKTDSFFKRIAIKHTLNKAVKIAKDEIVISIDSSSDYIKNKLTCESVINNKNSGMSKIIFLQRGFRECRVGHGTLKKIQAVLNNNIANHLNALSSQVERARPPSPTRNKQ